MRTQAELLKDIATNALKLKDLAKGTDNGDLRTAAQAIKTYADATSQYIYGAGSSASENNTAGTSRSPRQAQERFSQSSLTAEIRSIKKDALSLQQLIQSEEKTTRELLLSTWWQNPATSYAEHHMRVQEQWQHKTEFRYLGRQAHGIINNTDWIANNFQADIRRAKNRTAAGTPSRPTPKHMVRSSAYVYSAKQHRQHNQGVARINTTPLPPKPAYYQEMDTRN